MACVSFFISPCYVMRSGDPNHAAIHTFGVPGIVTSLRIQYYNETIPQVWVRLNICRAAYSDDPQTYEMAPLARLVKANTFH